MKVSVIVRVSTIALFLQLLSAGVAASLTAAETAHKKIVFVAGKPSHGYGAHEHRAGCLLLAKLLQQGMPGYEVHVVENGWPQDTSVFDGADAIVMYADGGGGHPVLPHLAEVDALADRGVGIVCLHYAVEVPKGEPGNYFLKWIGGYFETYWSVNPHWRAKFTSLPDHPITRGVKPFEIDDEWYYHMRFRDNMEGVTPILTAIPPASTLQRPDGPHSNNEFVRAEAGKPQHVAWAAERAGGGRGFGFTGGHYHWNWGDPNFRKIVLNAIVWTAHGEVPDQGVSDKPVTLSDLEANQDYSPPKNFNRDDIRRKFHLLDGASRGAASPRTIPNPRFRSATVTRATPSQPLKIDVDIRDARQLYLVVTDAGDGFSCDWADWAEPRLVGPAGELRLTDLKWKSATSDWGQVSVNRNAGRGPLRIAGKEIPYGIGTHANSVIAFDLPEGYQRFQAAVGLDNGGTDQSGCGGSASVQFLVYTEHPGPVGGSSNPNAASHDPADAVAALDVADGLEATLFASEPQLKSLTNLDVDHRGRVWVCEVVNYRRHNGERPEGDRILILEDTDGDGRADSSKVYYQGRDIDSAMGICVLGNRVIVSASPQVLIFTDEDGDDRPDRKEVFFANTGQPQHDHSAHSFLFGPDGRLYWNFGNTGQRVCRPNGEPVIDEDGKPVVDNGKPYYGGMPFRCNPDGSRFEVLGHNFRNNYEVTVDSFGTLWQSDNDDDGNRGVRINFVMEYGNYGYRDELTGASWQTPRTNMESETPLRHWHLNDPGVVPNLLQTGAGSPTGITVYEGRLLPKVFWDQVIHCDAGPNVVRAYPVQPQGAGYTADIVNVLHGARDNWFRPADVCVAPDGSLFVTDWYDPGVGGHNMVDMERGRLFRVAPPGAKYHVPKFDFTTVEGAIEALRNPNYATRYLAFSRLESLGQSAEAALKSMFENDENPRMRARALWLLGRLPEDGKEYIRAAAKDADPDIRIVALRLARQQRLPVIDLVQEIIAAEREPRVLRECAIALRHRPEPEMPELWAALASRHDGQDRWYLEALGIGADGRWDECLDAWLRKTGNDALNTAGGRDIVWRSRAGRTADLLAEIIARGSAHSGPLARYFRALDYQPSDARTKAVMRLAFHTPLADADRELVLRESLARLNPSDLAADGEAVQSLRSLLKQMPRDDRFVELVIRFQVSDFYPELLELALRHTTDSLGVEAIRGLLTLDQRDAIRRVLEGTDRDRALAMAEVLGSAADGRAAAMLLRIATNADSDLELRRRATTAAARTNNGAKMLLELAARNQLPTELTQAAAGPMHASNSDEIRNLASKYFPLPASKDQTPLPPLQELLKMRGDAQRGRTLFTTTAQCANCHQVAGAGKEVGPSLTEIGSKLSRQSLFESILFPSAGISHNYETYAVATASGDVVTGILVSRTDQEISIKTQDAIVRKFPAGEVDAIRKLEISLMPADLQKQMSAQDLVDVVEYLTTLKTP